MNDIQRDDLWDRLTDLALREAVGGKRPQESEAPVGSPVGDQVGDIMPASRVASAPGAAAGKRKRSASADRAPWTRPEEGPRRSALRVLVVSTCLLVGLTLVIVIDRAAGDRPWLWPVAKEDSRQLGLAAQNHHDTYIYDDVQYFPKGHEFNLQGDADFRSVLRGSHVGGQRGSKSSLDDLPAVDDPYSDPAPAPPVGSPLHGRDAGGQPPTSGSVTMYSRDPIRRQPPSSRAPEWGRDGGGIDAGDLVQQGVASRSKPERERIVKYLESVKKLVKDQTELGDRIRAGSGTPATRPNASPLAPEPNVPESSVLDPKPKAVVTLRLGDDAKPSDTTPESSEKDRKLLSELAQFRLAMESVERRTSTTEHFKQALDNNQFDSLIDLITKTVKPDSWKEPGGDGAAVVDGEEVALALSAIAGKDVGPDVVKEITARIRDGRGVGPGQGGDRYQPINENRFQGVGNNPLSTFSIDVDTASYSKVRRLLFQHHELPPPDAVRLEEFINYHVYHYAGPGDGSVGADSRRQNAIVGADSGRRNSAKEAGPVPGPSATGAGSSATGVASPNSATGVASYKAGKTSSNGAAKNHPFAVHGDVAGCPWHAGHKLLRIAIKGREIKNEDRPPSNLVFLVDVSGSMDEPDRLPLVKKGLKNLVQRLRATDRVAIVVYAGDAGLVLPSTPGNEKVKIMSVLDELKPQGSTNGAQGIHLAYDIAAQNFIKGGTNRVMLATDGDFNVGTTSDAELVRLVEKRAKEKVFLTTLGVGIGNHNDAMLQQIADKGNGQCFYLDSELEADKVLVQQIGGTLVTIAKDVKIQVEFNPAKVAAYRLLGYEKRLLRTEDFADDTKDAGEIGAGHTVTALYEIVPVPMVNGPLEAPPVAEAEPTALKYQKPAELTAAAQSAELLTVHMRYKQPEADKSEPLDIAVNDAEVAFSKAPGDFQFAAAVASFAMILRNSQYRGETSYDKVIELAAAGLKDDEPGYRAEFVEMVKRAKEIAEGRKPSADKK